MMQLQYNHFYLGKFIIPSSPKPQNEISYFDKEFNQSGQQENNYENKLS